MPPWLVTVLALLAAVGIIGAWVARVTTAQTAYLEKLWNAQTDAKVTKAVADHETGCAARGRAVVLEDDSGAAGAVQPHHYSPPGRVVLP